MKASQFEDSCVRNGVAHCERLCHLHLNHRLYIMFVRYDDDLFDIFCLT